jgi:hypothetical protein
MTGTATASRPEAVTANPGLARGGRAQINCFIGLGVTCLAGSMALFANKPALASEAVAIQSPPTSSSLSLRPDTAPLDLAALDSDSSSNSVYTATSFESDSMVMPSLWWMRDQFAAQAEFGQHFIKNWLMRPIQSQQPGRVDLVVDHQKWSQLDYVNRYEFITGFGTDAHRYGYNLRVFDERGRRLGASTCDFSQVATALTEHQSQWAQRPTATSETPLNTGEPEQSLFPLELGQLTCRVALNASGKGMLRGKP